jgi:hypothetical protein
MEIAISSDATPALCHDCAAAGCDDDDHECQVAGAFDFETDEGDYDYRSDREDFARGT